MGSGVESLYPSLTSNARQEFGVRELGSRHLPHYMQGLLMHGAWRMDAMLYDVDNLQEAVPGRACSSNAIAILLSGSKLPL